MPYIRLTLQVQITCIITYNYGAYVGVTGVDTPMILYSWLYGVGRFCHIQTSRRLYLYVRVM
jgi:hypothetical protein